MVRSEVNRHKARADKQDGAAFDRAEKQATGYFKRLKDVQKENDELRAKLQASSQVQDGLIGENRQLKRDLEDARIELNRKKRST